MFATSNIKIRSARTLLLAGVAVLLVPFVAGPFMQPAVAAGGTWTGQYWNLAEGDPFAIPGGEPDFADQSAAIDYDWADGSPDASINDDLFVARWTQSIDFNLAGTYRFSVRSDDGSRIFVDDELVVNAWFGQGGDDVHEAAVELTAGEHDVRVEMFEKTGDALIEFSYGQSIMPVDFVGQHTYDTGNANMSGANPTGFNEPWAIQIDTTHHRLFVAENEPSRILVFNLTADNELVDKTADAVLGQANFYREGCNHDSDDFAGAQSLCEPEALAYDAAGDRLFVADTDNNRVVVYDTATIENGEAAVGVLGQATLTASDCCDVTAASLDTPRGVAYDAGGDRLFVTDFNARVLVFDVAAVTNGEAAVNVLGQADLDDSAENCDSGTGATNAGFCSSLGGLAYDDAADRLFAADRNNHRVLVFDVAAISNGEAAVNVLGQPDFTTVDCCSVSASTVNDPRNMVYDPATNRLFVSDAGFSGANRVLVFEADPDNIADGEDALNVLGQDDFVSSFPNKNEDEPAADSVFAPYGVTIDATEQILYVADTFNSRVLLFDVDPDNIADGEDAFAIVGQSSATGSSEYGVPEPNSQGFYAPGDTVLDSVHHRLFVADLGNHRILVFNLDSNNALADKTADRVLGQVDLLTASDEGCDTPTAATLCLTGEGALGGLAYDSDTDHLYVTDSWAGRLLMYDTASITNGESAVDVLGQPDFVTADCPAADAESVCLPEGVAVDPTNHRLFVADRQNHRVLMYNLDSDNLPLDKVADAVWGQPDLTAADCNQDEDTPTAETLCSPADVIVDTTNHRLFVADSNNSRVLMYNLSATNDFTDGVADVVLGQPNFTSTNCEEDENGDARNGNFCSPQSVALDPDSHTLFVSDSSNSRILGFVLSDTNLPTSSANADLIIGQHDFLGNSCGLSIYALCYPRGISFDAASGLLIVADQDNSRILIYNDVSVPDADGDGLPSATEDAAPNNGDANNDGTADSEQANVTSFIDPVTEAYAVLEVSSECTNQSVSIEAEAVKPAQDAGFSYPAGLMSFTLQCDTPGFTATVTQYYYGVSASNLVMRKYNSVTQTYQTITGAVISAVTIDEQTAAKGVYQITDGSSLDEDGTANGVIVDPTGPGLNGVGTPNTGLGRLR